MHIIRCRITAIICLFIIFSLMIVGMLGADQVTLSGKLTRLHVIANSDSDEDQRIKLQVRDAILQAAEEEPTLYSLKQVAENVLDREKSITRDVKISLDIEGYPTREYNGWGLPAGEYRSLKVIIGEGKGRNWWCVIFPPLCFKGAVEFEETAENAGLTKDEIALIRQADESYVIRFKILELIKKLLHY